MTTLADATELHPKTFVTVKVYVPAASPEIIEIVPVPVVVVPPGFLVKVQVPEAGKPLNKTLPVATAQVGWVIVPTEGAAGVFGCALMTTLADGTEVHPEAFVTVKVNVPAGMPATFVLVPVPEVVIPPGDLVKVQFPEAGKPLNNTLPVASAQVG
jgi:hypothetical protein